jgi:UDP-N-acetylmuramyl pentapeptide phosphotransferase/UDP-N-acetylglucosamine-1-phosphate transferase
MLHAISVTFVVAALLAWLLTRVRGRWRVLDIPNERSLHTQPTPRTGGLAILAGAGAGMVTAWHEGYAIADAATVTAISILALLALVDDRHKLGAGVRLLVQIAVVAVLLYSNLPQTGTPVMLLPVALLFLVWMINLYNFMDGMDGFAAGMACIGFGTYAVLAWQAGHPELALGCAVIVAAAAGFLLLNFPPARLFMGDSGSTVLGLLAGIVILQAHGEGILPLWLGILIFSPFIVDASITLTARVLRGERFWIPHKTHYYQRVVQLGWGHRRTTLAEYGLMIACSGTATAAAGMTIHAQGLIIAAWSVIYAVLIHLIRAAERRKERKHEALRPAP